MKLTEKEVDNLVEDWCKGPNITALSGMGVDGKLLFKEGLMKAMELDDTVKISFYSLGLNLGRLHLG